MVARNQICTESSNDIETESDENEGAPSHASYEALDNEPATDSDVEAPVECDATSRPSDNGNPTSHLQDQAARGINAANGHLHVPRSSKALSSALAHERSDHIPAGEASQRQGIDAGTLAATARALNAGCQPIDFAQWGCTGTAAEGSSRRECQASQPIHSRPEQNGGSSQQDRSKQKPKVVMTQPGAPSAKSLDLTEEKRTAIQGAMKNIALDYMPQWAAALPEQAWIQALKGGEDR